MSAVKATTCANCGGDAELIHCGTCSKRMGDKGTIAALCSVCVKYESAVEAVGKLLASSSTSVTFECRPCTIYIKRKSDEELVRAVGGPTPMEVLKTVASTASWFIILQRATDEEKLSALNKLEAH